MWASMDSISTGFHFYGHLSLKRSVCSYIGTMFTSGFVASAKSVEFLSPIQAFATLWLPSFSSEHRAAMSEHHIGLLRLTYAAPVIHI